MGELALIAFTDDGLRQRVVFAPGALGQLREEVERFGAMRAFLLSTPGRGAIVRRAAELLGGRVAGVFERASQHVPRALVLEALAAASSAKADCCIAIGGGSAVGLAKALALETNLLIIAIPTTYAGSEATPIWGITDRAGKATGRDPRVLPRTIIYDPRLTLDLPPRASGASGMNAVAHCVEALYAPDCDSDTARAAEEGLATLGRALPVVVARPADLEARSEALHGAYLAGKALGSVSMGLHHQLCHVLGGSFGLPHAATHAAVLPYVVAFNAAAAPAAMARVSHALGGDDAASAIRALATAVRAPPALAEVGMREQDLKAAAQMVAEKSFPNPRPVTHTNLLALLQAAHGGRIRDASAVP